MSDTLILFHFDEKSSPRPVVQLFRHIMPLILLQATGYFVQCIKGWDPRHHVNDRFRRKVTDRGASHMLYFLYTKGTQTLQECSHLSTSLFNPVWIRLINLDRFHSPFWPITMFHLSIHFFLQFNFIPDRYSVIPYEGNLRLSFSRFLHGVPVDGRYHVTPLLVKFQGQ